MATTTITLTQGTLVASTSNAAASTTRGGLDLRSKHGGLLTLKITNGGVGPTVQCEGRVLISHSSGTLPALASAGSEWKTIFVYGGGLTANAVTEQSINIPPCMHLEVEFTGNTGQAVTVEAYITVYTDLQTV